MVGVDFYRENLPGGVNVPEERLHWLGAEYS